MTRQNRRNFLWSTAALSTVALTTSAREFESQLPSAFSSLKPLGDRVRPITPDEFHSRLVHAQQLMTDLDPKFDGIFVGPGTSLYYFTGVRWGPSERLLALVLPRNGPPLLVSPAFEEGRVRELLRYPIEVRVWQEDQSPTAFIAGFLAERGVHRVGIEEALPFTFFDHFRAAAPGIECVSADPVTIGCRARKSAHELELLRLACESTCNVYRLVFENLQEGMTAEDINRMVMGGYAKMGLHGYALVLLGPAAALPHGTREPQVLKEGDVVLIDDGCQVEGYFSDVTRTAVFGKPTEKIQRAYDAVRQAQDTALDRARAGKFSGTVDDAARGVITSAGFGPDYKFFTHRLGHGIGLDGHEHPYLVRGSKTVLEAGMTFSNEPGIYVPGEFGIRLEDLMAIRPDGPAELLTPGFEVSFEKPFG